MVGSERGRRRLAIIAAATVMLPGAVLLLQRSSTGSSDAPRTAPLPGPARAFAVPEPRPLRDPRARTRWAMVIRPAAARRAPSARAPVVARVGTRTPEGTTNLVLALAGARDRTGRSWVRVRLAVLPNSTTGWLPRRALGAYTFVPTRLEVDLRRLTATLYDSGRATFRARVGIGRPSAPTPRGRFYVRNRLVSFRSPFFGPIAFGTSARSSALTDWPGGGFIGIHGTNRPDLIPGRVSHGCVRMRNTDILRLNRLMPMGTPLTIT